MSNTEVKLIDNKEEKRFEMHIDDHIALIDYILKPDKIYLTHTNVPPEIGGRGIGMKIVLATLEEADRRGLRIISGCSFIDFFIERHPEWKRLL